jgi:hypothetical protein
MLTVIENCKYRLPCGHCDKFDRICTQIMPIDITCTGSNSITVEELNKYNKEQFDSWLDDLE